MALSTPIITFPWSKLEALYPGDASEVNINLAPSTTLVAGTVLGQVTSSANDVQTATVTGSPTGGTFAIGNIPGPAGPQISPPIANAATGATVQTVLVALLGTGNVTVTGAASGPYVVTFTGIYANMPIPALTYDVTLLTGGTPVITNVHTTTGRTAGTYAAYASGNSDGSQTAKLLLSYTTSTDSAGNHYLAGAAGSEWGQVYSSCMAYRKGTFATSALTGLDTAGAGNLGRLINGTVTAGIIQLI